MSSLSCDVSSKRMSAKF